MPKKKKKLEFIDYQEEHEGDNFPNFSKYEDDETRHPDDKGR